MNKNSFDFHIANISYKAYGDATSWKNFRGDDMPLWENLPENIQSYWISACKAVLDYEEDLIVG